MKYSKYQKAIFEEVISTNNNIAVNATAGSGKTTTIIEASKLIPSNKDSLFLAFNNSIVDELKQRLPSSVECSTIHSLGMRTLMRWLKTRFKLNQYKTLNFSYDYIKKNELDLKPKEKTIFGFNIMNLYDLCRMNMVLMNTEEISRIADYYDLSCLNDEPQYLPYIYDNIMSYNSMLGKSGNEIDFTDMITLPVLMNCRFNKYDVVFLDESQDMNNIQHMFIEKLLKPNGRLISVGDNFQAIYGFAGSESKSFEKFAKRPNTVSLPLSISYRCAKNIVEKAREVNDQIEPFENAPDGIVRNGDVDEIQHGDMVICRNVRPLIKLYFKLIKRKIKAVIRGRDIEKGLINLVSKYNKDTVFDGMVSLYGELDKLEKELKRKGVKKPKDTPKYINLYEKVLTIRIIADGLTRMKDVEKNIHEIFKGDGDGVDLMTIHKSKGLENDRVFMIESFENEKLCPSKYAVQPWQKEQEKNLLFVAYTRAKKELVFINL